MPTTIRTTKTTAANTEGGWPTSMAEVPFPTWPAALARTWSEPVVPLQIGCNDDLCLLLDEAQWPALRKALSRYCGHQFYLAAVATENSMRHSVDGRPVGLVSEVDRLSAALRLLTNELRSARRVDKTAVGASVAARAEPVAQAAKVVVDAGRLGASGKPVLTLRRSA